MAGALRQPRSSTTPHHAEGHRERLRARFAGSGSDAIADYELLEMVLFRVIRRGDTKPLAKALLAHFGSFAEVLSASPERLDLNQTLIRSAKALGVRFVINTDAHHPRHLRNMRYGVKMARRGWLTAADVVNTLPLDAFTKAIRRA